MEAEGIPAEVQYPSMNRYELFQPSLSRLPVCVEHADRLDPQTMSFPVAEAAGQRESVYFMENVFRDGAKGIEDAVGGTREDPAQRRRAAEPADDGGQPFGKNRGRCCRFASNNASRSGAAAS